MTRTDLEQRAHQVGQLAAAAAGEVDEQARFPVEAVEAMQATKMLSSLVPVDLGGEGAPVSEVARAVRTLAASCAASALVFAMHQIEVAYLARHGTTPGLRDFLRRVADEQLLVANANSEVGVGGDAAQSICAVERRHGRFRLEKQTLAISYGAHADAVIVTARSGPDAAATDQVLVLARPPLLKLEQTTGWNPMGLRGTCSPGFRLVAEDDEAMIFPEPFSEIATRTGSPVTQLLLGSVWWGLAEAAAAKAHAYVRAQVRQGSQSHRTAALRLAELVARLQLLRDLVTGTAEHYESVKDGPEVEDWGFAIRLRGLKTNSSSLAVDIATQALSICGMAGFSRESPYSLDRILRDAHGGPIMVNNNRFFEMNSEVLQVMKEI